MRGVRAAFGWDDATFTPQLLPVPCVLEHFRRQHPEHTACTTCVRIGLCLTLTGVLAPPSCTGRHRAQLAHHVPIVARACTRRTRACALLPPQAGRTGGKYCSHMTLLATACSDHSMPQCRSWDGLCKPAGSTVRQCGDNPPIPRCAAAAAVAPPWGRSVAAPLLVVGPVCCCAACCSVLVGVCSGSRVRTAGLSHEVSLQGPENGRTEPCARPAPPSHCYARPPVCHPSTARPPRTPPGPLCGPCAATTTWSSAASAAR